MPLNMSDLHVPSPDEVRPTRARPAAGPAAVNDPGELLVPPMTVPSEDEPGLPIATASVPERGVE